MPTFLSFMRSQKLSSFHHRLAFKGVANRSKWTRPRPIEKTVEDWLETSFHIFGLTLKGGISQ